MANTAYWQPGGAIGDVLFFFCSGYTLFLGKERRFDNYYKRRICRIYPTVFMWALMASVLFSEKHDMSYVVVHGGGWFVTCIMIYYVILHFVRRYALRHLMKVFAASLLVSFIWYCVMKRPDGYNMYGFTYFKWCHYFSFMLLGAMLGTKRWQMVFSARRDAVMLVVSVALFYGILLSGKRWSLLFDLQVLSLLPLLAVTYYFYKVCNSTFLKRLYGMKCVGIVMRAISGLCLEVYIVQYVLFTDKFNNIFPFNLLLMFAIILVVAYFLRCMSRWFSQTFKDGDYDWLEIVRL